MQKYKNAQKANPQLLEQYRSIYRYWNFIEKTLRQQVLAQKYQSLFANCILSNNVEAKASFQAENEEAQIELAAFPFSEIEDSKIKVDDSELKAKYSELKEMFRQYNETRDIKYVDVVVEASTADRAELQKQFAGYAQDLAATTDPTEVVRKSTSLVSYLGLPVKKEAFTADIAAQIDSMAVGQTSKVFETKGDNTLNVVKVVAKQSLPDSVQYRMIQVVAETPDPTANEGRLYLHCSSGRC